MHCAKPRGEGDWDTAWREWFRKQPLTGGPRQLVRYSLEVYTLSAGVTAPQLSENLSALLF